MAYTVEDLENAVESSLNDDWFCIEELVGNNTVDLDGFGEVRLIEQFGGEDQGTDYYIIFSVTDSDGKKRIFKRCGYHQSHDGSYLDGPTLEVEPVQKTITVYDEV